MDEEKVLTDDEIRLQQLHKDNAMFMNNIEQARIQEISASRAIKNYRDLLGKCQVEIKELDRKGVKHYEIKEPEKPKGPGPDIQPPQ